MAKIQQLPPHIADLIAAGEVVERPGSVVKELAENSIDAGATAITVEIQSGGMEYIRVSDDGCGISPEDAPTAFLRHATSKLRVATDLDAIGTLGFRGEALAAISAVSKIDLLTKQRGQPEGLSLYLEAGEVLENRPAGCPEGTTIIVRELFYNTPARLKFMKKDSAEGSHVAGIVAKLALSHPEVSFKLIREGKEELHTPGDNRLDSAVYSVLGRDFSINSLACKGDYDGIKLTGYITSPTASRGNRGWQYFFVNGRSIKSATLQAALEQAYKNRIMTGRFPGCVLHIALDLAGVDVNVHPTKMEVKFLKEKAVFDSVYYAALAALGEETSRPQVKFQAEKKEDFYKSMTAAQYRNTVSAPQPPAKPAPAAAPTVSDAGHKNTRYEQIIERPSAELSLNDVAKPKIPEPVFPVYEEKQPTVTAAPTVRVYEPKPVEKPAEMPPEDEAPLQQKLIPKPEIPAFRVIGEALATYIIVEVSDGLMLIDKHAAHERILFNKYKAQAGPVDSQGLLAPLVLRLRPEEYRAILDNTDTIEQYGFDLSDFGGGALAVRRVPADIAAEDAESLLSYLAQELLDNHRLNPAELRDELLHTLACRSAVKAGMVTGREELEALTRQVLSDNDLRYCPHGRPVAIELSRTSLEKQFKRIQ